MQHWEHCLIDPSKRLGSTPLSGKFLRRSRIFGSLALSLLLSFAAHSAVAQQLVAEAEIGLPDAPSQSLPCSVTGTIVDRDGAWVVDAKVTLTHEGQPPLQATAGGDGRFTFPTVPAGTYTLTITAKGFVTAHVSGSLSPGQTLETPNIILPYSATSIDVQVTASQQEIAQAQVEAEEKQRVLGIIPNFYVVYDPDPVPLTPRQKSDLAWRSLIDPVTFAITGLAAGIQQADDTFPGYGYGAAGYGKRYAANYGNELTGTILGGVVLPILFKQDPRYFYKGTGTVRQRTLYALKFAVYCKGDNGKWQINYSGILGSAAAGALSNLYYPSANRDGWSLTAENAGLGIAGTAVANLFQEFVVRKLTPHLPKKTPPPSQQVSKLAVQP
jgi:Carboxypeptidase regulatory-like domain